MDLKINYLMIFITLILPKTSMPLIYQVPITYDWTEFWKVERKPSVTNMLSTCPWRYKLNSTVPHCGSYWAELHPIAHENCLDLDQSSLTKRVHSMGRCVALRSYCACNKIVGYTCVYPVDIPVDHRNSEGKENDKNITNSGDGKNETDIDTGTITEGDIKNETKLDTEHGEKERDAISTTKPENIKDKTTPRREIEVPVPLQQGFVPPFLRRNNYQMGPPSYLQGFNHQQAIPSFLRPSQVNSRNTEVESVDED